MISVTPETQWAVTIPIEGAQRVNLTETPFSQRANLDPYVEHTWRMEHSLKGLAWFNRVLNGGCLFLCGGAVQLSFFAAFRR